MEDYKESGSEKDKVKEIKRKKNLKKTKKIIYIEFNSDNDKKEQTKNMTEGNQIEVEGKVHIKKKIIHYYDLSSEDDSKSGGEQAELQRKEKPKDDQKKARNKREFEKLLSPRK